MLNIHLNKAGGHSDQNVLIITTKVGTILEIYIIYIMVTTRPRNSYRNGMLSQTWI